MEIKRSFTVCELTGIIPQISQEGLHFRITMNDENGSSAMLHVGNNVYERMFKTFYERGGYCHQFSFESRDLGIGKGFFAESVDFESVDSEDLMIRSLCKTEERRPILLVYPPVIHSNTKSILELSSFVFSDSIHPCTPPLPFYSFSLILSKEEYNTCIALPPATAFRMCYMD